MVFSFLGFQPWLSTFSPHQSSCPALWWSLMRTVDILWKPQLAIVVTNASCNKDYRWWFHRPEKMPCPIGRNCNLKLFELVPWRTLNFYPSYCLTHVFFSARWADKINERIFWAPKAWFMRLCCVCARVFLKGTFQDVRPITHIGFRWFQYVPLHCGAGFMVVSELPRSSFLGSFRATSSVVESLTVWLSNGMPPKRMIKYWLSWLIGTLYCTLYGPWWTHLIWSVPFAIPNDWLW